TRGARGPACRGAARRRGATAARAGTRGRIRRWLGRGGVCLPCPPWLPGCGVVLCLRFSLPPCLLFFRSLWVVSAFLFPLSCGACEAEHGHGNQLLRGALAARGTAGEWRIADLLHDLGVVLAGLALVFVEGHELSRSSCCHTIITKGRAGTMPVAAGTRRRSSGASRPALSRARCGAHPPWQP